MTTKKNHGFTLIELVVVIVILGILAATAAPKFINLTSDAKAATLSGIAGSLSTGTELIKAKAIINNKYNITSRFDLTFDGLTFSIYNQGAVREYWPNGFENLIEGDFNYLGQGNGFVNTECSGNDFCVVDNIRASTIITGKGGFGIFFIPNGHTLADKNCFAYYSFEIGSDGLLVYKETGTVVDGC